MYKQKIGLEPKKTKDTQNKQVNQVSSMSVSPLVSTNIIVGRVWMVPNCSLLLIMSESHVQFTSQKQNHWFGYWYQKV